MIRFSVTKNGKVLDPSLYTWDEKVRTFFSNENGLVLDFTGVDGVTFKTSYNCTFNTGSFCAFNTSFNCTFNTGLGCAFITSHSCTFNTGSDCTFKTGLGCTFNTNFGAFCTFHTGFRCTFKSGPSCTFITGHSCTFEVGENCFVRRSDVKGFKGVTEIPTGKKIQLNDYEIAGHTIIEEEKETPTYNGKVVEIDGKQYKLTEIKE
jgi:hypothetical protein